MCAAHVGANMSKVCIYWCGKILKFDVRVLAGWRTSGGAGGSCRAQEGRLVQLAQAASTSRRLSAGAFAHADRRSCPHACKRPATLCSAPAPRGSSHPSATTCTRSTAPLLFESLAPRSRDVRRDGRPSTKPLIAAPGAPSGWRSFTDASPAASAIHLMMIDKSCHGSATYLEYSNRSTDALSCHIERARGP